MFAGNIVLKTAKIGSGLCTAALFAFSCNALAQNNLPEITGTPAPMVASAQPQELEGVGITEQLGKKLDLNLPFKDEQGKVVTLGSFFDGQHPVILSPVYFSCPGLCNFHLNGLTEALKTMDGPWGIGQKFQVLSVSFDPKDTPADATAKKATYLKIYDRAGTEKSWHFLTGDAKSIAAFTQAIGFKYHWDEKEKQWAHASAALIITPDGTISRYLPGIMFKQQDIKLALNEATQGKIGSVVDSLVLYCFHYDPQQSKYTLYAFSIMKMGGALMVLLLALWLLPVWIRSRKDQNKLAGR